MKIIIKLIQLDGDGAAFLNDIPFYDERDAHQYMREWNEASSLIGLNAAKYVLTYWK